MNNTTAWIIPPRVGTVFALGLALSLMLHTALHYWRVRGLPGFVLVFGALPWSLPWLEWWRPVSQPLGPTVRVALDVLFLSVGNAMNGTLVYVLVTLWRRRPA